MQRLKALIDEGFFYLFIEIALWVSFSSFSILERFVSLNNIFRTLPNFHNISCQYLFTYSTIEINCMPPNNKIAAIVEKYPGILTPEIIILMNKYIL